MNKKIISRSFALSAGVLLSGPLFGADDDVAAMRAEMDALRKTVADQNARLAELEKAKTPPPPPVAPAPGPVAVAPPPVPDAPSSGAVSPPAASGRTPLIYEMPPPGRPSAIRDRDAMNNQQTAAARPDNFTLDPAYRGFFPIPNTPIIVKFNVKPRVDLTVDSRNAGDNYRFSTYAIPVEGAAGYGGGVASNLNANGSQLSFDARAPDRPGNFRLYYQNDFFGTFNSDMKYRLQHLYAQYFNFTAGYTYGVFEDPDSWPDTVDYEGPNSLIFARRALAQYKLPVGKEAHLTFGVEKPGMYLDNTADPASTLHTPMPDLGMNARWERSELGHVQLSSIFRAVGKQDGVTGDQTVFGWGLNASAGFNITPADSLSALFVYGQGVGGMGNDTSSVNSDAAINASGDLEALQYWSGLLSYTHRWNSTWRSTVTYGYVNLENIGGQLPTAYHETQYASLNVIHVLRERLTIGAEVLYGLRENNDGSNGDVFRFQLSLVYSLF